MKVSAGGTLRNMKKIFPAFVPGALTSQDLVEQHNAMALSYRT
jgi:hypothetical protein